MSKLKQGPLDLVTTDQGMPHIDGLDVLRKAQELDTPCEVMVVTGHAALESVGHVVNLGACDGICKRLNIDEIRVVVDSPHGGAEW